MLKDMQMSPEYPVFSLENRNEENTYALRQYLKFIFWVHQFFCRYYALLVRMCTNFSLLISLSLYIKHSLYERKTILGLCAYLHVVYPLQFLSLSQS